MQHWEIKNLFKPKLYFLTMKLQNILKAQVFSHRGANGQSSLWLWFNVFSLRAISQISSEFPPKYFNFLKLLTENSRIKEKKGESSLYLKIVSNRPLQITLTLLHPEFSHFLHFSCPQRNLQGIIITWTDFYLNIVKRK